MTSRKIGLEGGYVRDADTTQIGILKDPENIPEYMLDKYYNRTYCDVYGKDIKIRGLREYDNYGNWTGRWLCEVCHGRYSFHSSNNTMKKMRDSRTGNLDSNCNVAKGDKGEELTDRIFETKRLSVLYDKYGLPLDHTHIPQGISLEIGGKLVDVSGKIPQTKLSYFSRDIGAKGGWNHGYGLREIDKKFDVMILWCMSKDGEYVEIGYIIPKIEIDKRQSVAIVKDNSRSPGWYEKYSITDEELLKKANEIWKEIINRK